MTEEEKGITPFRTAIIGTGYMAEYIKAEALRYGFIKISEVRQFNCCAELPESDTIVAAVQEMPSDMIRQLTRISTVPIIFPADFINGGAAIIVMPGDNPDIDIDDNIRLWTAKYISGYCTFWNICGCEWLHTALPLIVMGIQSVNAQKTAAHISARVLVNIAVGHPIKHFPRFYLSKNLY